ncbi:hypothetical protein [Streptomyces sp. NPDC058457]|uniref:hypothetical protein n=1 Tax=Streptomyces sp. NPDC058457 TaxID=3346507 RepID=UPI00365AFA64
MDRMDFLTLQEDLPDALVRELPGQQRYEGQHGELDTITAVVGLATAAIQAFSAWLALRRPAAPTGESFTVQNGPDGILVIRLTPHSAEPSPVGTPESGELDERVRHVTQLIMSRCPPTN